MTDSDLPAESGEGLLKERQKRFWRFTLGGAFVAALVGIATGSLFDWFAAGAISPVWLIVILAAMVAVFVWFTIEYFRRVDELDWMDNLWAGHIGLYAYFIVTFCWYFLAEGGLVGQPQVLPILVAVSAAMFIAYGLRKLGWR